MLLLSQRALGTSDVDHALFVDRSLELRRVQRALKLGLNVYVHGPRGIGRTSFLRQVQRDNPEARYARLIGLDGLSERLDEIERQITNQSALNRRVPNPLVEAFSGTKSLVAEDPFRYLRAAVQQEEDQSPFVVLVDDIDQSSVHELFGRWRDSVWELPIQWVVTGTSAYLEPPADSFFDVAVELTQFDCSSLEKMVQFRAESGTSEERRDLQQLADSALASLAPCTPRAALSVIRDLYLSEDREREASELQDLSAVRAGLKATPAKVLDALVVHGPTHAGDDQLLAEVNVTRSRVVQVLAELEAKGLVAAERVGRRKLYSAYPKSASLRRKDENLPRTTVEPPPKDSK
ncbi:MAG: AAA family ATPase [Acidimicrobiaceae bacterium]|nr:AAA family ATPase [Acidimicrobiaceae bacterium]MYD07372.1 AAA family ATPase [Acidimicrobiaceae bacterium]MYI59545.1 AAA family ATPase [Acidimicrobiaceae bacterium]